MYSIATVCAVLMVVILGVFLGAIDLEKEVPSQSLLFCAR